MSKEKNEKKRMKPIFIVLIVLAALLVLLVAATGIFIWYSSSVRGSMFAPRKGDIEAILQTTPTQETATDSTQEPTQPIQADWIDDDGNAYNYRDDVISILLMGVDYMGDESHWDDTMVSNGGNADIMALVTFNVNTFDTSILYVPRDTMTDIIKMDADGNYLGTAYTNITVSHSYGDGKEMSCRLTTAAVSHLLYGIPINRYVALNYDAFATLNELLGGLKITFKEDHTDIDPSYTKGSTVVMDSEQLRRYITYRDRSQVEGAYDRGARSMEVLQVMFNQCKGRIAANPTVALDFWDALSDYLVSDMDLSEVTYLATNISKIDFSSDTVVKIPGNFSMGERYAEFYADEKWLHDFVVKTYCVPAK